MPSVFLFLALCTWHGASRSLHTAAEGVVSCFLWLSKVPLCHAPHFFAHPSIGRHLVCFHVPGCCNIFVMNIEVHVFELWISLDMHPGLGLLDHMVVLFLIFFN